MYHLKYLISILFCAALIHNTYSQENVKRYEVKSGKMTLVSEIFGKEQDMLIYFDDYGVLEYSETVGEIMGFKINNAQIKKEGYIYNIDLIQRTCKRSKLEENTPQNINFSNMTQKLIEDLHIEKKGTEEYIEKTCDLWIIDHPQMKMKGSFLVWKGIALKTDLEVSGMIIRMKTKTIDINSSLPEGIFNIPSDVKIIEQ